MKNITGTLLMLLPLILLAEGTVTKNKSKTHIHFQADIKEEVEILLKPCPAILSGRLDYEFISWVDS